MLERVPKVRIPPSPHSNGSTVRIKNKNMPSEIELEKTYLLKYFPEDLKGKPSIEIFDMYIPTSTDLPHLRIRKRGEICEITKKEPMDGKDSLEQSEHTIRLTQDEFSSLKNVEGKNLHKMRYLYPYGDHTAEIDVYQDNLRGLVFVDFEFKTRGEKDAFVMPDFCLAETTQDYFCAAGWLAGKQYADVEPFLDAYGYKKKISTSRDGMWRTLPDGVSCETPSD